MYDHHKYMINGVHDNARIFIEHLSNRMILESFHDGNTT